MSESSDLNSEDASSPTSSPAWRNRLRSMQQSAFYRSFASKAPPQGSDAPKPWLYEARSSQLFALITVAMATFVDTSCYSLAVPVIPYRLEELGYDQVPSLTGWLVAAYGIGLVVSSPPIAYIGERCKSRRTPLLFFLICMIGAIMMFMFAESLALMIIARFIQGVSGTGIWTLGMALICDVYDEEMLGHVFGYIMIAFAGGTLVGPVAGGGLYKAFGFHAPFVFAIIITAVDAIMRLVFIEKPKKKRAEVSSEPPSLDSAAANTASHDNGDLPRSETSPSSAAAESPSDELSMTYPPSASTVQPAKISSLKAFKMLARSKRAMTALGLTLLCGFAIGGPLDGGLTLYLSREYGLTSDKAGLVFIASVVPNFFASPVVGMLSDWWGAQWIVAIGHIGIAAAFGVGMIRGPLWVLIFGIGIFGASMAAFSAVMADLTKVGQSIPGLGYAHVFGLWNGIYSIGAVIGPIVGNNILEGAGIVRGWRILLGITIALATIGAAAAAVFLGQEGTKRKKSPRHEV